MLNRSYIQFKNWMLNHKGLVAPYEKSIELFKAQVTVDQARSIVTKAVMSWGYPSWHLLDKKQVMRTAWLLSQVGSQVGVKVGEIVDLTGRSVYPYIVSSKGFTITIDSNGEVCQLTMPHALQIQSYAAGKSYQLDSKLVKLMARNQYIAAAAAYWFE